MFRVVVVIENTTSYRVDNINPAFFFMKLIPSRGKYTHEQENTSKSKDGQTQDYFSWESFENIP